MIQARRSHRPSTICTALLAAAALVMAGCGAADEPANGADEPPPEDSTEEEVDTDEPDAAEDEPADEGPDDPLADARDFYEGETITFVVHYDPGGGYDRLARAAAPYIAEELNAEIVVDNQPGAGGLLAMNNLLNQTEPDGLTIMIASGTGLLSAVISGSDGVQFDTADIGWIGRFADDPHLLVAAADGRFDSWDAVLEDGAPAFGSQGPGTSVEYAANLLNEAFELDGNIVRGFDGSADGILALLRGDIDLFSGGLSSRMGDIESGETIPIILISEERNDLVPDTPTPFEYDLDPEWEDIFRAHSQLPQAHRSLLTQADVPQDRIELLREIFENVMTNEDFLQEMEDDGVTPNYLGGADLTELIDELLDAPPRYAEILTELSED